MTVLPLLSLISRNSPKQLGMVSPEPEAACHSSGRIRQLPQIQAASGSYTLQIFQASQGFTAFPGILLHLLPPTREGVKTCPVANARCAWARPRQPASTRIRNATLNHALYNVRKNWAGAWPLCPGDARDAQAGST